MDFFLLVTFFLIKILNSVSQCPSGSLILIESTLSINASAYYNCGSITSLYVPSSLTYIGFIIILLKIVEEYINIMNTYIRLFH